MTTKAALERHQSLFSPFSSSSSQWFRVRSYIFSVISVQADVLRSGSTVEGSGYFFLKPSGYFQSNKCLFSSGSFFFFQVVPRNSIQAVTFHLSGRDFCTRCISIESRDRQGQERNDIRRGDVATRCVSVNRLLTLRSLFPLDLNAARRLWQQRGQFVLVTRIKKIKYKAMQRNLEIFFLRTSKEHFLFNVITNRKRKLHTSSAQSCWSIIQLQKRIKVLFLSLKKY